METKTLDDETLAFLQKLEWRGNVRQLQNTCRWLMVMAPGQVIRMDDLPPELLKNEKTVSASGDWLEQLRRWAEQKLSQGDSSILDTATPQFERVMIEAALKQTSGRRQDAAKLLGWGRNTLTRKIKELGMENSV